MEQHDSSAPDPAAALPETSAPLDSALPAGRHDAFTPELMARFCEVLAQTGIVSRACRAVGKCRDTVYEHRRCNPLFAAGWAGALSHARHRLADTLLEHSIEGSVDYIYRDGQLVGERRYVDNRLAYAMLRRLDKQAEAEPAPVAAELARRPDAMPARPDWTVALRALRTGSEEDLRAALALFDNGESDKTDKTDNPPVAPACVSDSPLGSDRVYEEEPGIWRTNFPPPPDFCGEESGRWDDDDYERDCTPEECALLAAAREAALSGPLADEEAERDSYFADLQAALGLTAEQLAAITSPSTGPAVGLSSVEDWPDEE
jgi:hypothetical protein